MLTASTHGGAGARAADGTRATSMCVSVQLKVVAIYEMTC
jgi:hypothetical protein